MYGRYFARARFGDGDRATVAGLQLFVENDSLALDPLRLVTEGNRAPLPVDVLPAQSEQLAGPRTGDHREDEEHLVGVTVDGVEEGAHLLDGPDAFVNPERPTLIIRSGPPLIR